MCRCYGHRTNKKNHGHPEKFGWPCFVLWMPPRDGLGQRTILSNSEIQSWTWASDGMRQSPRGEKLTRLIFGPSGMQERLNCWLKKRQ